MEAFVKERDKLIEVQEEKKAAMKRRQWEEEVELEKAFNAELTQLMDKYSPHHPDDTAGLWWSTTPRLSPLLHPSITPPAYYID